MTRTQQPRYDKEAVKAALSLVDLCRIWNVELESAGVDALRGCCPVHGEKTGSFYVHPEAGFFKCFGCGMGGADVFALWAARYEKDCKSKVDWPVILEEVAKLAGVGPGGEAPRSRNQAPKKLQDPSSSGDGISERRRLVEKPWMPELRGLHAGEREQLSRVRWGISVEALAAAEGDGRLFYSEWPLGEDGRPNSWSVPSWFITDNERWCGQYRSLSGRAYYDREGYKSSSTKNVSWAVGCGDIGDRECVVLTEGGADLLAGYHFLQSLGLLDKVALCCLFGASARLAGECVPFFQGKRVRILMDEDEARERKSSQGSVWTRAGTEWCWYAQEALKGVAASVKVVSLRPIVEGTAEVRRAEGGWEMKDLNDLVRWERGHPGTVDVRSIFDF